MEYSLMKDKFIKLIVYTLFILCILFTSIPVISLFLSSGIGVISEIKNHVVINAFIISMKSTLTSLIIIIILGIPSAYIIARKKFRFKKYIETILEIPLVLPPSVAGLILLITFGKNGIIGKTLYQMDLKLSFTFWAVVISQVFVALPLFIKTAKNGIEKVDKDLELTAATLGDKPLQIFMNITLPLSYNSILTGVILAWARSLAEFGATIMFAGNLAGRTQTLPLAIYSAMEIDMNLSLAIASILVIISVTILVITKHISNRN
ncbi:molybdate ABC transporter permease subunit [Tepidibacter hydrothermalis]|uniref:Molybdenum transport system permease n=1 Tax=Tepidibacter hydrothermalis TaxID=3036126 RepID=A0ABY8ECI4_9FIRM|nr:molybdate ABC transporter permease subunit [Tepidibacter hydrothermalis]WFD10622.1 molybdate ABC transporter permease subunit [Tepidibacter hydrothermalis]